MASKRYYWIKLKKDFFRQKEIKLLRKIAGGDTFTIIYLKMLLVASDKDGTLRYESLCESIAEEIALDIDEDVDNVEVTLSFLQAKGLLEINEYGDCFLPETLKMTGSEVDSAERVRKHREKKLKEEALQSNIKALHGNGDVTICNTEIEKEIEINKETEEEQEEADKIILSKELKERIITEWNKLPVADIRTLSDLRSKKIKILLQTYGEEDLFKAIDNINKSKFLQGINDRGWVITIDWFLKGNNFIKVLEGNYNKGKQHKQQAKKKGVYKVNSDREEADYNKIANRFMEGL